MHPFSWFRATPALAMTLLLASCGGGGNPSPSPSGTPGTPLSTVNRDAAAGDSLSLGVNGSLAASLKGYYVPAATAISASGPTPYFSLTVLEAVLQQQSQIALPAPPVLASPVGVATTGTTTTTSCPGGGSYTLTSNAGSAVWVYTACVDSKGNTLNGQVTSQQLDSVTYQGDFSAFTVIVPNTSPVHVDGRLVYSSNATATEMTSPQLRLSMDGAFTLTLSNYLLRVTNVSTQTKIEAHGHIASSGNVVYAVDFDDTNSSDVDQAPFYRNNVDTYPYTGSLKIQDSQGNSIRLSAVDNVQVLITYKIGGTTELVTKSWSQLL